jgi:hypothetical protein
MASLGRIKTLVESCPLSAVKPAYDDFKQGHLVGRAVPIPEELAALAVLPTRLFVLDEMTDGQTQIKPRIPIGFRDTECTERRGSALGGNFSSTDEPAHANRTGTAERAGIHQEECGYIYGVAESDQRVCGCSRSTNLTFYL